MRSNSLLQKTAHYAFLAERRYLGRIRFKCDLKSVKRRCRAVSGESGCATVQIARTRGNAFEQWIKPMADTLGQGHDRRRSAS